MFKINKFFFKAYVSALSLVCLVSFSEGALAPWASNTQPSDVAKNATMLITSSNYQYVITHGGYMDGENCRSPISAYDDSGTDLPIEKTWESNRRVKMENTGTNDLVNPWLSNGRNNFRNMTEIVNAAIAGLTTEKEKALALYWQEVKYRCHKTGRDNSEISNPVKIFNIYGHNTCGNDSVALASLWKAAGFTSVQPAHLLGHSISQVYYDSRLNLMDGDQNALILLRDNETVANEQDIVRDHDLSKRTHELGILYSENRGSDESHTAEYMYDGDPAGSRGNTYTTNMNMTLRPNEAITWRWGVLTPIKYNGLSWSIPSQYVICNGLWEYTPDFTNDTVWRNGALSVSNITNTAGTLTATSGTGTIVWKISSPYVIVGGSLAVAGSGYTLSISWDNSAWTTLSGNSLDSRFPTEGTARYTYYLRCQLTGSAQLTALRILNDIEMSGLVLPGMIIGDNTFTYTDQNTGGRSARITHEWVERNISRPPNAPPSPIYPSNGGDSDSTQFAFRWNIPTDPDGDAISDYHFELSNRQDMKWPLSNNFYRLISKTDDSGNAQYTLLYPGQLTPDKTYYWHVRAKDNKGVWGSWSATWSFTARGPAYPINVTIDTTTTAGVGILRWSPNPVGRAPAKYRIYGSDEKGFTISDTAYTVVGGNTSGLTNPFPSNFVCETTSTQLNVMGAGLALPNTNKAYYRVVAVDSNDKRSWSSDYASAPGPFIYSVPVTTAQAGHPYQYRVSTIRSIGDLRCRTDDLDTKFWDIETPKFALQQSLDWLVIDENTGLITGMPGTGGTVIVSVTLQKEVRVLDADDLAWGSETVLSSSVQTLGPFTQEFTINAGTVTDTTPPSAVTQVRDGTGSSDEEVTNSVLQLSANWTAATDAESGVYYKYAIGTTAGASDVINWTYSSATSVTKTGLSLTNGQRYYFSVYAKNGAGMQSQACDSNGILVVKPPTIFADNFDGWTAKPGPWDSAAGESSVHVISTATEQNKSGGSCLKAVDNASSGAYGAYMQKAFSPGISGNVYIRFFVYFPTGFKTTGGSRTLAQFSSTGGPTLYISWIGGMDFCPFMQDSPSWGWASWNGGALSEGQWYCYETHLAAPSASTAFEFWVDGVKCSASLSGKNFGSGTWDTLKLGDIENIWDSAPTGAFYLDELVVADHYIGTSISTGQPQQDTTAPAAPAQVRDGTGSDMGSTTLTTQLSANWDASTDAESGIAGYQYAIGTTAGGTNVTGSWISSGMNLTATKTGLSLTVGSTYYFAVRALNGSGLTSVAANSNGQYVTAIIDTTPPSSPPEVRDGTGSDSTFTNSTTTLSANWTNSSDTESGIVNYQYAIGTTSGGTDVVIWADNGQLTSVTKTGLSLAYGQTYYFSVKAINSAGLAGTAASSNGQTPTQGAIDTTPPEISAVDEANITRTAVTITCNTNEPARVRIEYGPTTIYGSINDLTVALATQHTVVLPGLAPDTEYHYRIKATDGYGNEGFTQDFTFRTSGVQMSESAVNVYPNPYKFSGNTPMNFWTDNVSGAEIRIYTLTGKLVKTLAIQEGQSEVTWDGKNEDGEKISRGVYIYKITGAKGSVKIQKLAVTG